MEDVRKNGKQYGLIYPKKTPLAAPKAINVFGDDNDTDEDDGTDWVKKALKAEGEKNRIKKQTRLNMQKALSENPTIYQYDEVFDEMKQTEEKGKAVKQEVKKSKYIGNLLKTAERRKREQEHRIERMVQKEREAEGEMYADKESFVTSAYKSKLEELKKLEEEEQNMERLEALADVTKQPDMSGFYRHFFQQTVDPEKKPESNEESDEKKDTNKLDDPRLADDKSNVDKDDASSSPSEKDSDSENEQRSKKSEKTTSKRKQGRQYRQRVLEASESESEAEEPKEEEAAKENNSIKEKPSEDNTEQSNKKRIKLSTEDQQSDKELTIPAKPTDNPTEKPILPSNNNNSSVVKRDETEAVKPDDKPKEKEKKISIWEKRTVGPVFEAALQRYYARKAARSSGM